jgi:3-phenylpropionate/trans-cinnamate dioxygenase ferredoxin reductase subunit
MTASSALRRVVVVGGSIAAVTAAESLRVHGFAGRITLLSEETHPPYSRVPLSKGVLSGEATLGSAALPALSDDVEVRLGSRAARLRPELRRVVLTDGEEIPYDGLVIATGARARRLAPPGQAGEYVVRTMDDAERLAERIVGARSAIVIGGGFLGMEIASVCVDLGLQVTLVDREPPLRRLLGSWLAGFVVDAARERGVDFVLAPEGVTLLGGDQVAAVDCGHRRLDADVVVSAVGDQANTDWLLDSGLPVEGGLVVDGRCRVTPHITAAGDVTVTRLSSHVPHRSPHWTSAVLQGQAAAVGLLLGDAAPALRPDPYFWTEQFGLNIKISGVIPDGVSPTVLAGDPRERSALLQWQCNSRPVAAVAVNHRLPVVKLKRIAAQAGAG